MDRAEWLAQRATGIGGSDAAAVFNVGYGCTRRLAYEKRGIEPDYERETSAAMSLGNLMEPWFADRYAEQTGRQVSEAKSYSHSEHPELRVNIDRLIAPCHDHDGPGVLEIKSQGLASFVRTKRQGLIEDYILQMQWAMVVTGCKWGSFAIGCRDSGELIPWDVERDDSYRDSVLTVGPALWKLIKSDEPLPARLDIDDKRCAECSWRRQCQGNAFFALEDGGEMPYADDVRPLLTRYDEQKPLFDEAEALLDETKDLIRITLEKRPAVAISMPDGKDRKIYFRAQDGRVSWKTDGLVKSYDSLRRVARMDICQSVEAETEFDLTFPPIESFKREGVPFRTLRIY